MGTIISTSLGGFHLKLQRRGLFCRQELRAATNMGSTLFKCKQDSFFWMKCFQNRTGIQPLRKLCFHHITVFINAVFIMLTLNIQGLVVAAFFFFIWNSKGATLGYDILLFCPCYSLELLVLHLRKSSWEIYLKLRRNKILKNQTEEHPSIFY